MPGHVGAGVGLGDAEARDLLALDRGHQVLLLLLLGAEQEDRRGGHVGVDRDPHRQAARLRLGRSPRRARGWSSSRRPGRRTPRGRRGRGSRARPCAGRPSRGRWSPPTPRRGGELLLTNGRIDSRSRSCSSLKMKWRFLDPKSGLMTFSAVAMTGGVLPQSTGWLADGNRVRVKSKQWYCLLSAGTWRGSAAGMALRVAAALAAAPARHVSSADRSGPDITAPNHLSGKGFALKVALRRRILADRPVLEMSGGGRIAERDITFARR